MKSSHASPRGTAALLAAAVLLTIPAHAAPKSKPESPPATEAAAPAKKGVFGKLKSIVGLGKKEAPATVEAPAPVKPAAKSAPKSKDLAKPATAAPAPAKSLAKTKTPPPVAEEPAKKGFIKRLFTREEKPQPDAGPELAKAKTAKPAPVKEIKPSKAEEKLLAAEDDEPKKKRGLFSFLRRERSVMEEPNADASPVPDTVKFVRPDDWEEHRVVTDDSIALYEFGPSQSRPDARLDRGTIVKVKSIKSGWALVEVTGGKTGYMDAGTLRDAVREDFSDPVVPAAASMASISPDYWAPLAPPPDLPDQPGSMENDPALLLLPPLELEPKENP